MSRQTKRARWLERVADLPTAPGVYIMKDKAGEVVYVGKAKSLRARVRQYFQEGTHDYRAFVGLLGGLLSDIETRIARSEKEALLLERELIRLHEPRFNVIWRDDKQFLRLRVDPAHEYPWVQVVRNVGPDGARYFGPFHSASAARQTLRVVNRHFKLRTCRDSTLYNRKRPCLEHQIGRCPAPCVFDIDRDAYRENVDDVMMFLEGRGQELAKRLQERMWGAAEREAYEAAAYYRDQLRAVEKTLRGQKVAFSHLRDQDVYGVYREGEAAALAVVEVRGGRVTNIPVRLFEGLHEDDVTLLTTLVLQRYEVAEADGGVKPPQELVLPVELPDAETIGELLSDQRGKKVRLVVPKRGDRMSLLEMARDNAKHGFTEERKKSGAAAQTLDRLQQKLRLRNRPTRIECYDISNLQGEHIVGSGVCFVEGEPDKRRYRRYKVKTGKGQDDFASMYDVLTRRFRRGLEEDDLPDLVVIDGGKGQLNVARAVFDDLGVEGVDLVSLAKSRTQEADEHGGLTRSPERVFLPEVKDPIVLRQTSAELLLLARLRDEAHRFAITFQRKSRDKSRLRSSLDDISGIGPAKRRALLAQLGSLQRVKEASPEELAQVPGIGARAAQQIWSTLNPGAAAAADAERRSSPPEPPESQPTGPADEGATEG